MATILVIDDNKDLLDMEAEFLNGLGHNVLIAGNGLLGVGLIDENHERLDLVISDFHLPILRGYEIAGHVKKQYPHIKVMIQSADTETKQKALSVGCDAFLIKPFKVEDFRELVEKLLGMGSEEETL
ncbi:MAG: response regulator [Candidatus Portnoybacteria bacterium]|nr:response regulator [Candidatus Portnoybacteria bacterium]